MSTWTGGKSANYPNHPKTGLGPKGRQPGYSPIFVHATQRLRMAVPATIVLLGGCGGGGGAGDVVGGSITGLELPALSTPSSFENTEYFNSTGLEAIGASSVYAVGGTGAGVTVGVIDTGIDTTHADFVGAIDPNSININTSATGAIGDASGHGTTVAGVIGARRNSSGTHGVAHESNILAVRAEISGSCSPTCSFDQNVLASATNYAVANGARVINYSLGGAGALATSFRAALNGAVDQDRLVVIAAGNDGSANPTYPGRYAGEAGSDGRAIVVGAVDASNVIASFSNRAGVSAANYLVAPGVNIRTTEDGGGTTIASGTSLAAPFVSGAAAAVFDAAPYLNAAEVTSLLLNTATDLGAAGTDSVYGRGMVNLDAALAPQGTAVVPSGDSVDDGGVSLSATSLSLGPAFGDALTGSIGSAMFLDAYGRSYSVDLNDRIKSNRHGLDLHQLFERDERDSTSLDFGGGAQMALGLNSNEDAPWSLIERDQQPASDVTMALRSELSDTAAAELHYSEQSPLHQPALGHAMLSEELGGGGVWNRPRWLSLAYKRALPAGWQVDASLAMADDMLVADDAFNTSPEGHMAAATLMHKHEDGLAGLQIGQMIEQNGGMDSVGDGAFGLDGAQSTFVNVFASHRLTENVTVSARALVAHTAMQASQNSLIDDVDAAISTSFGIGLSRDALISDDDKLTVAVSQPHRVESGTSTLHLPTSRSFDGDVNYRRHNADLEPSGREIDVELGYRLGLTKRLHATGNLMLRLEPGHATDSKDEAIAALRLHYRFH